MALGGETVSDQRDTPVYNTTSFIKVPRDLPLSGVWSRYRGVVCVTGRNLMIRKFEYALFQPPVAASPLWGPTARAIPPHSTIVHLRRLSTYVNHPLTEILHLASPPDGPTAHADPPLTALIYLHGVSRLQENAPP